MCEYYGVMCLDWYPVYIGPDSDEYDQNEGLLAWYLTVINLTLNLSFNLFWFSC